jgi:hypothetical protein
MRYRLGARVGFLADRDRVRRRQRIAVALEDVSDEGEFSRARPSSTVDESQMTNAAPCGSQPTTIFLTEAVGAFFD